MHKITKFWVLTLITGLTLLITILGSQAQEKLTEQSRVYLNGIGAIHVRMTVKEAAHAAAISLIQVSSGGEEYGCLYFEPKTSPQDVSFMVLVKRTSLQII